MKLFSYLFLATLLGAASSESLRAQEKAAMTSIVIKGLTDAYHGCADTANYYADLCNPLKLPVRYVKLTSAVTSELGASVFEACMKKECNQRLGFACLQSLGLAALTVTPWVVWQIWGKKMYNKQIDNYKDVAQHIKNDCSNVTWVWQNIKQARTSALKVGKKCKTTSTLFTCQDKQLLQLINSFYDNFGSPLDRGNLCVAIGDYCAGYK